MTRDRDIERVLEAWLRPGPTVMPDRLFDGVLERIERQPQRRLVRIHRRITNMRPTSLMLVAAAIVVAVGAGVVLLGRPAASSVGTPTSAPSLAPSRPPAATAAASSSISAGEVPAALQYHWVSAPRLVAQASSKPVITVLTINFTTIAATINASSRPVLASTASATGPNSVSLTLVDALFGGCSVGDTGSYTWSEAPDGMTMTLVAANDACAARAAAFAGTWTKAGCPGTADPCLGQVPAGTYASTFFDLRSAAADVKAWGAYGQLRYTAPDGWANSDDSHAAYSLVPAPDFYGAVGEGQAFHGIYVNSRATAMATTASCSQSAPGVGHSANAIATWIAANPGLTRNKLRFRRNRPAARPVRRHSKAVAIKGNRIIRCISTGYAPNCFFAAGDIMEAFQGGVQTRSIFTFFASGNFARSTLSAWLVMCSPSGQDCVVMVISTLRLSADISTL